MYTVAVLCVYSRGAWRRNFAEGFSGVRARSRGMVYVYARPRRVPASMAAAECDPRGKRIKLPPRREQRTIRRAIREGGVEVTVRHGVREELRAETNRILARCRPRGAGFLYPVFSLLFFSSRISFLPESTFRNVLTWRRRDFRLIAVN